MEQYRIIKALSGFYYVQTEDGVVECRARGRFRRQDQSPLVGDFVRITRQGAGKGVLEELLPRKNAFIRPAVANIDQLVVLASCAVPGGGDASRPSAPGSAFPLDLDRQLAETERDLILRALEETGGVQVKAAELLNISERSMWHRIKKLGINIINKKEMI